MANIIAIVILLTCFGTILYFRLYSRRRNIIEGVRIDRANLPEVKKQVDTIIRKAKNRYVQESALRLQDKLDQFVIKFENEIKLNLSRAVLDYTKNPLPNGIRFVVPYDNTVFMVVEQPPCVRTIKKLVREGARGIYETHYYRLAFPYMVFIASTNVNNRVSGFSVACRNRPLKTLADPIYRIHLPNIYKESSGLGVCDNGSYNGSTPGEQFNDAINSFWQSAFTGSGLTSNCNDYRVESLYAWQQFSQNDPMLGIKIDWEPAGFDLWHIFKKQSYNNSMRSHRSLYRTLANKLSADVSGSITEEVKSVFE